VGGGGRRTGRGHRSTQPPEEGDLARERSSGGREIARERSREGERGTDRKGTQKAETPGRGRSSKRNTEGGGGGRGGGRLTRVPAAKQWTATTMATTVSVTRGRAGETRGQGVGETEGGEEGRDDRVMRCDRLTHLALRGARGRTTPLRNVVAVLLTRCLYCRYYNAGPRARASPLPPIRGDA